MSSTVRTAPLGRKRGREKSDGPVLLRLLERGTRRSSEQGDEVSENVSLAVSEMTKLKPDEGARHRQPGRARRWHSGIRRVFPLTRTVPAAAARAVRGGVVLQKEGEARRTAGLPAAAAAAGAAATGVLLLLRQRRRRSQRPSWMQAERERKFTLDKDGRQNTQAKAGEGRRGGGEMVSSVLTPSHPARVAGCTTTLTPMFVEEVEGGVWLGRVR